MKKTLTLSKIFNQCFGGIARIFRYFEAQGCVRVVVVFVVIQHLPKNGGMVEDHGAPEAVYNAEFLVHKYGLATEVEEGIMSNEMRGCLYA